MKTTNNRFSLLLLAVCFVSPAFAQHNDHRGGGGGQTRDNGNRATNSSRQNYASVNPRNFSPRQNNTSSVRQYDPPVSRQDRRTAFNQPRQNTQTYNGYRGNNSTDSRNHYSTNNNTSVQHNNRGGFQNNTNRGGFQNNNRFNNANRGNSINRGNNTYRGNSTSGYGYRQRGYSVTHYNYFPRRYPYFGYGHYSVLPRTSISIYFGGTPYYYNSGLFYGYYNGFYEPIYAPFGIRVSILPVGYYPFYVGPTPYYYYGGTYYRDYGNSEYEVVDAPMGAVINELPKGAKVAMVNGEQFYEFNGTYYKEGTNSKNQVVYTVVGKNGEINNSDAQNDSDVAPNQPLRVGDIIFTLPDNCRQVMIDGKPLFVSPDNIYFKETVVDGATTYEVVGTDMQNNQ